MFRTGFHANVAVVVMTSLLAAGCGGDAPSSPAPPADTAPASRPAADTLPAAAPAPAAPVITTELPPVDTSRVPALPGWRLIWHDEFDGPALDDIKWRAEDAALEKNNEQQYYTPEDVFVRGGNLVLRSQRRERGGRPYTSGLVETKGRFSFRFGRVEVRAKLPGTKGVWPAHWMLPADGSWPPEIDFMELLGHEPNRVYQTNHWGRDYTEHQYDGKMTEGPDFTAGFHTFAVEWEPEEIRWFVDGKHTHTMRSNVPTKPFFIILNTAVGGDWPGFPDATTVLPQEHLVDYVRVWQRDETSRCSVEAECERGQVSIEPRPWQIAKGSIVTLRCTPDIGYRFVRWTGDREETANPLRMVLDRNLRLAAVCEPDPAAPPLVSRGKVATGSSQEAALAPNFAVDANPRTRWGSGWSDNQWLMIDLGAVHSIAAVQVRWEAASAKEYEIQVSADGTTWTTVKRVTDGTGGVAQFTNLAARGRFVRLNGISRNTKYGFSVFEFEVYGRPIG